MVDKSTNNDVAVSIRTSFGKITLELIRPITSRGNFQLVFCFGGKNGDKDVQSILLRCA